MGSLTAVSPKSYLFEYLGQVWYCCILLEGSKKSTAEMTDFKLRVVCLGAGYVGGPTMAVIALKCPHVEVKVVDLNAERIAAWNSEELPVYEPGLYDVVKAVRGKNLFFEVLSDNDKSSIRNADVIYISVNTPTKTKGIGKGKAADLKWIEAAARMIGTEVTEGHKIIVEKSTVPVKCSSAIKTILTAQKSSATFSILSNPEFLAEGTAIKDLMSPDRVLVGASPDPKGIESLNTLVDMYANWVPRDKIITTNLWSSELSKLVSNAMLAQRVSSINAISAVCEATGANVKEVSRAIGYDSRIGPKFLKASVGFGGSCFQKDILNLVYLATQLGLPEVAAYWESVIKINDWQRRRFTQKMIQTMFDTVSNKQIAILGFAFKEDTGDTRESSAIPVCCTLLEEGANLEIYDPKVPKQQIFDDLTAHGCGDKLSQVTVRSSALEAIDGAHSIAVLTQWSEFIDLDWELIVTKIKRPQLLFDGRNFLPHENLHALGFNVFSIGRPPLRTKTHPTSAGVAGFPFEPAKLSATVKLLNEDTGSGKSTPRGVSPR